MRIVNPLHFTEHHRFCMCRDFSLSPIDQRMLSSVYQPIIGGEAAGLYSWLYQQLPADQAGYSEPEQQLKIFLSMGLEPSDRGRSRLIALTSRLEAVGLMESWRQYLSDREPFMYIYRLFPPLSPQEFFRTQHLALLLRDKLGEHLASALKQSFYVPEPAELELDQATASEDLSIPFYELFQVSPRPFDAGWEQEIEEDVLRFPTSIPVEDRTLRYEYADIIRRFPRQSVNRGFVENLKYEPDQMEAVNYVAVKYDLSLPELCRLLDEDGIFSADGELRLDTLQYRANLTFRQDRQRQEQQNRFQARADTAERSTKSDEAMPLVHIDVPDMLRDEFVDAEAYTRFLFTSPYTVVLKQFFPGSIPGHVLNVFENLDLNYKLKEEVINVLIHFLKENRLSWNKNYIDSIASDMLGKQVERFDQAVAYFRDRTQPRSSAKGFKPSTRKKPDIPIIDVQAKGERDEPLTEEELREIQNIVKELDGS